MRRIAKLRLSFFAITALSYYLGFQFIPESLSTDTQWIIFIGFASLFFVVLPLLFWVWIIKAGGQKAWKILIPLSLGSLVARYSFPAEFAEYFEFIAYIRYPIMAILIILELVIMVSIVKALWQARHLKGDPRIAIIDQYKDEDEKKLSMAFTFAYEPASWYYAIPWFTRNHQTCIGSLNLRSGKIWHFGLILLGLVGLAVGSYLALVDFSEILATFIACLVIYGVILLTANYRVSRHFSIYVQDQNLIINNSIFGFILIPTTQIQSVQQGSWSEEEIKEEVKMGSGTCNIEITFTQPIQYMASMGMFIEPIERCYLSATNTESIINAIEQKD